jgi:A/G-specific adenine glycosylase
MDFSENLLHWYERNKRDLPWRGSRDPYTVWLSEIILQQTRVAQGMPYFERFLKYYPTVGELAAASETEVLKLWQGLGYYSRARNLHATARHVALELGGRFPYTYQGLLSLKGVGPYTAAAIASICYDLPHPVVDGNVYRVLSRYFGVDLPVNSGPGKRYFDELSREVMNPAHIGQYNQAIMEFGAVQCVPQSPVCGNCPLNASCKAFSQGRVKELPVKLRKGEIRIRQFHYIMAVDSAFNTILQQRTGPGIWRGLYEFPLLEQQHAPSKAELLDRLSELLGGNRLETTRVVCFNETPIVHKLSHQHLYTTFWVVHVRSLPEGRIALSELDRFPVPVLISNFIETVKNSYF